jgi:hypothetical protein
VPLSQSEVTRPAAVAAQERQTSDAVQQFLLAAAAADFHKHGSHPAYFRDVQIGRAATAGGGEQYRLCGQFLAKGKPDWVPFVTVKTSGYEQWLGDQAASFCKSPPMIWESGDLSSSLQGRFASLR